MSKYLNSGLNKVGISKEISAVEGNNFSGFGVASKDFTKTEPDSVFYFEQDLDSPLNPTDTEDKVVKKSTRARQIQSQRDMIKGKSNVSLSFSNNISKNDFMSSFAPMFFQHSYLFVPTITNGTITAISNDVDTVTITVTSIGTLKDDDYVNITGRTVNKLENDNYCVSNVTATTFDIEFEDGFDDEIIGTVIAELNKHKSVYEDNNDCTKHYLDSSFSFYMPYGWDKTTCTVEGDILTGLVPKTGSIDFVASTYTIDVIGKLLIEDSVNLPSNDDYIEFNNTGGFYNIDSPMIKDSLGNVQDCSTLTINIENAVTEDLRSYRGGKLSSALIDGSVFSGSYSLLFKSLEDLNNHSKTIYENRKSLQNGGSYSIGLESSDGSSIYINCNMIFMNEQKNKVTGGWELATDFEILYDDNNTNISLEVVNGIGESMAELFNTEA